MDFLGIGPLELLFIFIIIIVVIGPRDIEKTTRTMGRTLNRLYKSDGWKAFNEISRQLRTLPNRLAQEAELDEVRKTAQELSQEIGSVAPGLEAWTAPKTTIAPGAPKPATPPASSEPNLAAETPTPDAPTAPEAQPGSTEQPVEPAPSSNGKAPGPIP